LPRPIVEESGDFLRRQRPVEQFDLVKDPLHEGGSIRACSNQQRVGWPEGAERFVIEGGTVIDTVDVDVHLGAGAGDCHMVEAPIDDVRRGIIAAAPPEALKCDAKA
jgi:hypothetical protein